MEHEHKRTRLQAGEDRRNRLADVDEVASLLKMSRKHAYRVIRKLNLELETMGFITERGRVSLRYLEKRYGLVDAA